MSNLLLRWHLGVYLLTIFKTKKLTKILKNVIEKLEKEWKK